MNSNDISMMIYLICVLVTLLIILFLFFSECLWLVLHELNLNNSIQRFDFSVFKRVHL